MKLKFILFFNFFAILLIFNSLIYAMEKMEDSPTREEFLAKNLRPEIRNHMEEEVKTVDSFEDEKIRILDYEGNEFEIAESDLRKFKAFKNLLEDAQGIIDLRDFKFNDPIILKSLREKSVKKLLEMTKNINKLKSYEKFNHFKGGVPRCIQKLYRFFLIANAFGAKRNILREILLKLRESIIDQKGTRSELVSKEFREKINSFLTLNARDLNRLKINPSLFDTRTGFLDLSNQCLKSLDGIGTISLDLLNVREINLDNNILEILNVEELVYIFPNLKKISAKNNNLKKIILPQDLPDGNEAIKTCDLIKQLERESDQFYWSEEESDTILYDYSQNALKIKQLNPELKPFILDLTGNFKYSIQYPSSMSLDMLGKFRLRDDKQIVQKIKFNTRRIVLVFAKNFVKWNYALLFFFCGVSLLLLVQNGLTFKIAESLYDLAFFCSCIEAIIFIMALRETYQHFEFYSASIINESCGSCALK